jgi:IPT/TIG domain
VSELYGPVNILNQLEMPRSTAAWPMYPPGVVSTTVWSASPAGQVGAGVQSFNDADIPSRIKNSTSSQPVVPGPPSVLEIFPTSGPVAGGTSVTIAGSGFTSASSVKIGGTNATGVVVNNDGMISAVSPAHAAGAVDVAVTTPVGTNTLTAGFTYH